MNYIFNTQGVCAKQISLEIIDGLVRNVAFTGGCNGNLKALAALCEGQTPEWVIERVKGITCGPKPTSCSDQLSKMLELVIEEEKKQQEAK